MTSASWQVTDRDEFGQAVLIGILQDLNRSAAGF